MANHTITVQNTLDLLGGDPPTLWGNTGVTTMTWGTDTWGANSEDMQQVIDKVIGNTLTSDTGYLKDIVFNGPIADTLTFASTMQLAPGIMVGANALTFSSEVISEVLTNGIWYYVWRGGTTEHESQISTSYSSGTAASTSYSTPSPPPTSWT